MGKIILLENGIRLVHEFLPHRHSVSVGVFVKTGSRNETKENNGISHFIEHCCFKGTPTRNCKQINENIAEYGGYINAFTSKEMTAYYISCVDMYVDEVTDILADIVVNHTFPDDELDRERGVVLEEIAMCEDDPEDTALQNASTAFWGDQPVGYAILGLEDNVKRFTSSDLHAYCNERYVSSNIVISVSGNISEEKSVLLIKKYFLSIKKGSCPNAPAIISPSFEDKFSFKDNAQSNLFLTYKCLPFASDKDAELAIINTSLGSGSCNFLFQRLREELGLVYSAYSFPTFYSDGGSFNIYLGTSPEKLQTALTATKEVLSTFSKGIQEDDFRRSKRQIIANYVLGQESTDSFMRANGKYALFLNKTFNIEEKIKSIENVTLESVNSFLADFFGQYSIGYVGKKIDFDIRSILK